MMGAFLLSVMILNSLFRLTINSKFICVCEKIIVVACVFITLKVYHKFTTVLK
jgi:hypothetical protein